MAAAQGGTDVWSIFLRQRRMWDQLRRLGINFQDCHCPPGCRGGPQDHVGVDPATLPRRHLRGPYVRPDSALPPARNRTEERRHPYCRILAEARGTSDIRLRDGTRGTLRMSLQVHTDTTRARRRGYYGEMWLTRHEHAEEFVGAFNTWLVDRTTDRWEEAILRQDGINVGDMGTMRDFFLTLYGLLPESRTRDDNGVLLPTQEFLDRFGAPWAMLNGDTDILYIPLIFIRQPFAGQRIIDPAFELLFRLMTGGTLPEPYNVTRPLTALLEAGVLGGDFGNDWVDPYGRGRMDLLMQVERISQAYERNGFMRLGEDYIMGRRVVPGDHPAAPGDVEMQTPDPPGEDPNTPSPVRRRRFRRAVLEARTRRSPLFGREGTRPRDGQGGRGGQGRGKGDPRPQQGGLRLPGT